MRRAVTERCCTFCTDGPVYHDAMADDDGAGCASVAPHQGLVPVPELRRPAPHGHDAVRRRAHAWSVRRLVLG